ncbi:hypothetical protein [Ornithinibacillus halotolerans]|uniref:DUF4901 domain-containing protein n=1 Tax=Ornithinibacillus halotolerans TaxID=1274357 RepID=A0A916S6E0_9BACI|nr:hypothetical protein [Ornithinibacillus halotolerans]GGA82863.1 hypothetical protein GCM10008025_27510 [Ornithinibacillus halotolerans]
MNENIQEIASSLQEKYGLDEYLLKRSHLHYELTLDNQTNYILSLEWFLKDTTEEEENFNPAGSCVMDIDFHTKAIRRIIFVNDVSYAKEGIFPSSDIENVIEWIEELTDMMFGRQFKLVQEEDTDFYFEATVDNMEVAPTGSIKVSFNDKDQLTEFSIDGVFPEETEIDWEPFSLTKEDLLDEISQHLSLVETPIEADEKWVYLWNIDTFYIRNDKSTLIFPEAIYNMSTYIEQDSSLQWENPSEKEYSLEEVDFSTEITLEEAINKISTPPLTEEEIQASTELTREFVSKHYPSDSGKWKLTGMYPEKNYIITEVQKDSPTVFNHKFKVIINRKNGTVANYWDSKYIFDMFQSYEKSAEAKLTKEEALEKILPKVNITPVYVKTAESEYYQLCAKVDCDYVVQAITGEVLIP